MNRIREYILIALAIALTVGGALYHGHLRQRWGLPQRSALLAQRLASFPTSVGNWQLRESFEMTPTVAAMLQCSGYINRSFVDNQTGSVVTVAVMIGPAGPISVHTPEVCYSSRDFKLLGDRQAVTVRDSNDKNSEFWSTEFDSQGLEKSRLRVLFGWTTDGRWSAVDNPRFAYAGQPFLFKMQLATVFPSGANPPAIDPCVSFLSDFIPALDQHVFVERPAVSN